MQGKEKSDPELATDGTAPRAEYVVPRLVRYGSLKEFTRLGGLEGTDGGGDLSAES